MTQSKKTAEIVQLDWIQETSREPNPVAEKEIQNKTQHSKKSLFQFQQNLENHCGQKIQLKINQNQSTWLNFRPIKNSRGLKLSLHEAFLDAPENVISAIAGMINHDDVQSHQIIQRFINEQSSVFREHHKNLRKSNFRTRGVHHDLGQYFDEVMGEYFQNHDRPSITWGKQRKLGRNVMLGCYLHEQQLIRIHPVLDHAEIPENYLKYVIYHEMLHHILPEEFTESGRRIHHSKEFRRLEKNFSGFEEAMETEKKLFKILSKTRTNFLSDNQITLKNFLKAALGFRE